MWSRWAGDRRDESRGDGGQVLPLVLGIVTLTLMAAFLAAALVAAQLDRSRATTAADAGALAGALADETAARDLARRNGGELVDFERQGDEVEVVVEVDGVPAAARARRLDPPPETVGRMGLRPEMLVAIARAEGMLGTSIPIVSGYRSTEHQRRLWEGRHRNPYPVARPGTSRHESGLAIDVPSAFAPRLAVIGPRAGLCRPLPRTDPIHFELCPTP